jgi:uncharacterized protein (TIGR03067 family)
MVLTNDLDEMQGTWRVTYGEVGGRVGTPAQLKGYKIIIEGTNLTMLEGGNTEYAFFDLIPGARPRQIDFFPVKAKKKGLKNCHGIYQFDGTSPNLCWGPAGKARPRVFNTKAANDRRYYILSK